MESISKTLSNLDAMVCAKVLGRDVTRAELLKAFDTVADKSNWKKAIDARVPLCSDFELLVLREAIIFFTGSVPEIVPVMLRGKRGLVYRVQAAGYYQAVGP